MLGSMLGPQLTSEERARLDEIGAKYKPVYDAMRVEWAAEEERRRLEGDINDYSSEEEPSYRTAHGLRSPRTTPPPRRPRRRLPTWEYDYRTRQLIRQPTPELQVQRGHTTSNHNLYGSSTDRDVLQSPSSAEAVKSQSTVFAEPVESQSPLSVTAMEAQGENTTSNENLYGTSTERDVLQIPSHEAVDTQSTPLAEPIQFHSPPSIIATIEHTQKPLKRKRSSVDTSFLLPSPPSLRSSPERRATRSHVTHRTQFYELLMSGRPGLAKSIERSSPARRYVVVFEISKL